MPDPRGIKWRRGSETGDRWQLWLFPCLPLPVERLQWSCGTYGRAWLRIDYSCSHIHSYSCSQKGQGSRGGPQTYTWHWKLISRIICGGLRNHCCAPIGCHFLCKLEIRMHNMRVFYVRMTTQELKPRSRGRESGCTPKYKRLSKGINPFIYEALLI